MRFSILLGIERGFHDGNVLGPFSFVAVSPLDQLPNVSITTLSELHLHDCCIRLEDQAFAQRASARKRVPA